MARPGISPTTLKLLHGGHPVKSCSWCKGCQVASGLVSGRSTASEATARSEMVTRRCTNTLGMHGTINDHNSDQQDCLKWLLGTSTNLSQL